MATSAATLELIIGNLSTKFNFDKTKALEYLAAESLLPKKLIPTTTEVSPFASSKAEALALQHNITPDGEGSGKHGRWTLADVNRKLAMPTKKKTEISAPALNLANANNISICDIVGTGQHGRILLKDVHAKLSSFEEDEEETLNISQRALQEANENGIKTDELKSLVGTGVKGKILLEDVKKHIASSASSSDDEDED